LALHPSLVSLLSLSEYPYFAAYSWLRHTGLNLHSTGTMASFVGTKASNSSVKSKLHVDSMNEDSKLRSVVHTSDSSFSTEDDWRL
jgi:hypothetical protein